MSKPLGGQYLDEIEADLMFGELPDEDLSPPGADESEIDANNDETFGAEIVGGGDELEDYAAQTACLRLDDGWGEKTGFNVDAPDASQLPIPDFGLNMFEPFKSKDFEKMSFGKLEGVWHGKNSLFDVWDKEKSNYSILTPSGIANSAFNMDSAPAWDFNKTDFSSPFNVPSSSQNFRTAEDLERELLGNRNIPQVNSVMTVPPVPQHSSEAAIPTIPTSALSAEELEKNFLRDSTKKEKPLPATQVPPSLQPPVLPPGFPPHFPVRQPPQFPNMNPGFMPPNMNFRPPQFPPIPPGFRQYVFAWCDVLLGKTKYLPPNTPPVHPMVMQMLYQTRDPKIVASMLIRAASAPTNVDVPVYTRQFGGHKKAPGMPSDKTIEDLALDKFAGFMSWKERQYLERIQSIQCQGNGNPYEEDYYYICWKQKRTVLGDITPVMADKKPTESESSEHGRNIHQRRNRETSKYNDKDEKKVPLNVKFAGSLGLPTKCTTSNPRHLISVNISDNNEDENEDAKPQAGAQKKLRTLLIRVEAALSLVMQINEKRIALQQYDDQESKAILIKDIENAVQLIYADLLRDDLSKVLQINKGRLLFSRLVQVCFASKLGLLINCVFQNKVSLAKSQYEEVSRELIHGIHTSISRVHKNEFNVVFNALNPAFMTKPLEDNNTFCCQIFLSIIHVAALNKVAFASPFRLWLKSPENKLHCNPKEWDSIVKQWIKKLNVSYKDVLLMVEWCTRTVVDVSAPTVCSYLASTLSKCLE